MKTITQIFGVLVIITNISCGYSHKDSKEEPEKNNDKEYVAETNVNEELSENKDSIETSYHHQELWKNISLRLKYSYQIDQIRPSFYQTGRSLRKEDFETSEDFKRYIDDGEQNFYAIIKGIEEEIKHLESVKHTDKDVRIINKALIDYLKAIKKLMVKGFTRIYENMMTMTYDDIVLQFKKIHPLDNAEYNKRFKLIAVQEEYAKKHNIVIQDFVYH